MKNHSQITKAVIAVAGYGTRFLPATKNQPKEMLPIIDRPIIHELVAEAVNSGIKDIILVTRFGQHIMEDYFDNNLELEHKLEETGKLDRLAKIQEVANMANFIYVRQKKDLPYGNGTPLLAAKNLIDDNESFVYMFGDDLTISNNGTPIAGQLMEKHLDQKATATLAVQEVPKKEISRYGSVEYKTDADYKYEVKQIHEKLPAEEAPSTMAQFGRFVFSYDVVEAATKADTGKDGELWIADILNDLADAGKKVIAPPIEGEWLTTGDPLRYLKATFEFAMLREDLRKDLLPYLEEKVKEYAK
ncbi:UTP--glucose-1-phosphate uridylyltransferase [candidate division WWE3 bacterium]|nr:UTP--glucose-1-phosphate uridylyltransferase [candidate division WWE3 bacterium]